MKQYLSVLLRNQFNLFYRFGYTFIPNSELIGFDGAFSEEIKLKLVNKFATTTPFEYDEEYLILHLDKEPQVDKPYTQFEIQDIVAVYPLSKQAKISIESKIDQRIKLEQPIFESALPKIESEIECKEVEKAISALWAICKIEEPLNEFLSVIGLNSILKGIQHRKDGTKAFKIQNGNYWEYLIAYDRFDFFPNTTLGYFYDAGQVFAFSKGLPTFEGSGIHNFLEKLNSANPIAKLPDIIKFLETEEQLKRYVSQTTTGDIKQYIVAPLYLMLRDEIRKSDDIAQTKLFKNLDYLKKFEDSFNYAVILLGAFFGFRKFYDNYYETLNLRFYKGFKVYQKETATEEHQEQVTTELKNDLPENVATDKKIEEQNLIDKPEEENKAEKQTLETKIEETSSVQTSKSDISSKYQKIIQDLLNNQKEVKLTEIKNKIKKQLNETKTVDEIKELIINLKIEAESVQRKTNTIKRLDS